MKILSIDYILEPYFGICGAEWMKLDSRCQGSCLSLLAKETLKGLLE
jgi:hypothetical protein